jgi:hypothetical protein
MLKLQLITGALFSVAMWITLFLLPSRVWACACCAYPGEYQIGFDKPDAYKLSLMERMRLGTTADRFVSDAEPDEGPKGFRILKNWTWVEIVSRAFLLK